MIYLIWTNGKCVSRSTVEEVNEIQKADPNCKVLQFEGVNQAKAYVMSKKVSLPDRYEISRETAIFYVSGDMKQSGDNEYISWSFALMIGEMFIDERSGIVPKENEDYSLKEFLGSLYATEKVFEYCVENNVLQDVVIAYQPKIVGALANKEYTADKPRTIEFVKRVDDFKSIAQIHFLQVEKMEGYLMLDEANYLAAKELKKFK